MLMSQTVELQTTSTSKHISGIINRDPVAHSLALVTTSQHLPFGRAKFSSLSKRTETVGVGFWTWATSCVWPSSLPDTVLYKLWAQSLWKSNEIVDASTQQIEKLKKHTFPPCFSKSRQHLDLPAEGLSLKNPLNSKVALRYKGLPKLCQEM